MHTGCVLIDLESGQCKEKQLLAKELDLLLLQRGSWREEEELIWTGTQ